MTIPRRDQGSFLEKERQGWVLKWEECIPGRERREPGVQSYTGPGRPGESARLSEGGVKDEVVRWARAGL